MPNCFDKQTARRTYTHTQYVATLFPNIHTPTFFSSMCVFIKSGLSCILINHSPLCTHHTIAYTMPFHRFVDVDVVVVFFSSVTCHGLDAHTWTYVCLEICICIDAEIHALGQSCVVGGRPEATAINNIELSSFFCSSIDYLDWQATNICMGALGGNASGDRERQRRVPK